MTSTFRDDFDRENGVIGTDYLVPCGKVSIDSEAVIPLGLSGTSPETYDGTNAKAQVLLAAQSMDGPNQVIRGVWAHDDVTPSGVHTDPAYTILARMTKDPLLVDLGVEEDPYCFDQGYGARVTCPRDGSAPILKIIKFQPVKRPPNLSRPSTIEPDGATVLAYVTLEAGNLNIDPAWNEQGNFPYRGFWQDMRLRIYRGEAEVVLEVFLNDRYLNQPLLTYTDRRDPLWSITGAPGFEFLSAILNAQPSGASPYELEGEPLMRCSLFEAQTIKVFEKPLVSTPDNLMTYDEVTKRVITLVEKNGDAKYTATAAGQTKMATYLQFVLDAEADIIRKTGYWHWLWRDGLIYLVNGQQDYEVPEDCGLIDQVRPGNFSGPPLAELTNQQFRMRFNSASIGAGPPRLYTLGEEKINNRKRMRLYPVPQVVIANNDDDAHLVIEYYRRRVRPTQPSMQIPLIPQENIDVLVWGAAAHAMILDTDMENTQATAGVYASKIRDLTREQWRLGSGRQDVARSAVDVNLASVYNQVPLLRLTQLGALLLP